MASHRKHQCNRCGRWDHEVGLISYGGRCTQCAEQAAKANRQQLKDGSGPYYDRWRHGVEQAMLTQLARNIANDPDTQHHS